MWTLASIARAVADDEDDETRLRRFLHEFGLAWEDAAPEVRPLLVVDEPPPLGARWDAFVAAYAEHLCWHAGLAPPGWAGVPSRYLSSFWFPGGADLPTLRNEALVHAPAHFEAHGVLLARRELEVV